MQALFSIFIKLKNNEYLKKMKKIKLIALSFLLTSVAVAQTATNFTVNDCNNVSHDLFTELDAGKIIVITWVMPCGSCTGAALSAYSEVQNYAATYPNRVYFYLVDDIANTSCNSLSTWASTNGITFPNAVFSNAAISMADYGTAGMPKTVVIGGASHTVYFNQNDGLNVTNFNTAIQNALNPTGISSTTLDKTSLVFIPNPVTSIPSKLKYSLIKNSNVKIDIINAVGQKVSNYNFANQYQGEQELSIDMNMMPNGVYFVILTTSYSTSSLQFTISK